MKQFWKSCKSINTVGLCNNSWRSRYVYKEIWFTRVNRLRDYIADADTAAERSSKDDADFGRIAEGRN